MEHTIRLDANEPSKKALDLLRFMLSTIKGQDKAIEDLIDAIEIYESGLFSENSENKPIYVGLCCGPSGVGKTLTAELLSEFWFNKRNCFTKISCESYSESHSISRLIGSPAGYVGYWDPDNGKSSASPILWQGNIDKYALEIDPSLLRLEKDRNKLEKMSFSIEMRLYTISAEIMELFEEEGDIQQEDILLLSEKAKKFNPLNKMYLEIEKKLKQIDAKIAFSVIKNPKSIILFDEIEKASPALHNILLNVIDKGEITLSNGMKTDFSNSVILMTTNVGSRAIAGILNPGKKIGLRPIESSGVFDEKIKDNQIYKETMKEVREKFPPEFLARFDRISVYRPLGKETLRSILEVEIEKFQNQVLKKLPIKFCFDEEVKDFILNEATDKPQDGARLVKLKVYKYLRKPLCRMKNNRKLKAGDILYISLEDNNGKKDIVFKKETKDKKGSSKIV
ncbi:MAG: AAA family ATPase [Nanoarchaeota archaeon]|nr:AAA family ATPase [Patescibacteria group bacterium]MCG2719724.1 AAA family ATPase [Nanoarchaeota archaeon]